MLPVHLHTDPLVLTGVLPSVSGKGGDKKEDQKHETPVFCMSSIASCTQNLCELATQSESSFKSTYHVGVTRMEALKQSMESTDIEEEEISYYHKPARRTFISTSYSCDRPLCQSYSASNKRRKVHTEGDESEELSGIGRAFLTSGREVELALSSGGEQGSCLQGEENLDNLDDISDTWENRPSLFDEDSGVFGEATNVAVQCGKVCKSIVETTALIEKFVNPSLEIPVGCQEGTMKEYSISNREDLKESMETVNGDMNTIVNVTQAQVAEGNDSDVFLGLDWF